MAWPSSTKASTANVDAGTDQPKLARADIKQNIDNVNAIIDEFDIAAPNDGDILQYNSTSGAWEPGATQTSGITSYVKIASGEELVSGSTYRSELSELFDNGGIISLNGSYQFTLTAGTYIILQEMIIVDDSEAAYELYNETDASSVHNFFYSEIGTTGDSIPVGAITFTISDTKNFSFRQTTSIAGNRGSQPTFRITK